MKEEKSIKRTARDRDLEAKASLNAGSVHQK